MPTIDIKNHHHHHHKSSGLGFCPTKGCRLVESPLSLPIAPQNQTQGHKFSLNHQNRKVLTFYSKNCLNYKCCPLRTNSQLAQNLVMSGHMAKSTYFMILSYFTDKNKTIPIAYAERILGLTVVKF